VLNETQLCPGEIKPVGETIARSGVSPGSQVYNKYQEMVEQWNRNQAMKSSWKWGNKGPEWRECDPSPVRINTPAMRGQLMCRTSPWLISQCYIEIGEKQYLTTTLPPHSWSLSVIQRVLRSGTWLRLYHPIPDLSVLYRECWEAVPGCDSTTSFLISQCNTESAEKQYLAATLPPHSWSLSVIQRVLRSSTWLRLYHLIPDLSV